MSQRALELSVEHAKTREQFGKPIGIYQAVSHRLADGYALTELARSLAYWAAWCVSEDDDEAPLAAAAAKAYAGDVAVTRLRVLDPGARRHRLHLGAPAAPLLQARAVDPGLRRLPGRPARRSRRGGSWLSRSVRHRRVLGIGAASAERLARAGWKVFAGVRAEGAAPDGTTELLLDVTDGDAIARAAETVGDRLDGLVDNAGIALAAPLEYLPLDDLRRQLEVNVVGQLAVIQALMPAIRAARGRIVLVGSIAGTSALPFLGPYAISKFGLEALADSLRLELAPDGIHVAIVRPGTIATPIWSKPQPIADTLPARGARSLRTAAAGDALLRRGARCQGRARRVGRRGDRARAHRREPADALPGRPRRPPPRRRRDPARPRARPRRVPAPARIGQVPVTVPWDSHSAVA